MLVTCHFLQFIRRTREDVSTFDFVRSKRAGYFTGMRMHVKGVTSWLTATKHIWFGFECRKLLLSGTDVTNNS